ncbi:hypothetical protein M378DRAFT_794103 [Amanita muscaria Koide BX008]|uniref:Uncharacterized protein n=1 Tax=Amanita muscaria (strain Koide BX008) TaxID=946122 RepID=A0A0C2WZX6_AMAMK|nr:hypothetical protein M378DRAFT_794103 [Amanita muscaria Koide BX008]
MPNSADRPNCDSTFNFKQCSTKPCHILFATAQICDSYDKVCHKAKSLLVTLCVLQIYELEQVNDYMKSPNSSQPRPWRLLRQGLTEF